MHGGLLACLGVSGRGWLTEDNQCIHSPHLPLRRKQVEDEYNFPATSIFAQIETTKCETGDFRESHSLQSLGAPWQDSTIHAGGVGRGIACERRYKWSEVRAF